MALRDLIRWKDSSRNVASAAGNSLLVLHRGMNRMFDEARFGMLGQGRVPRRLATGLASLGSGSNQKGIGT